MSNDLIKLILLSYTNITENENDLSNAQEQAILNKISNYNFKDFSSKLIVNGNKALSLNAKMFRFTDFLTDFYEFDFPSFSLSKVKLDKISVLLKVKNIKIKNKLQQISNAKFKSPLYYLCCYPSGHRIFLKLIECFPNLLYDKSIKKEIIKLRKGKKFYSYVNYLLASPAGNKVLLMLKIIIANQKPSSKSAPTTPTISLKLKGLDVAPCQVRSDQPLDKVITVTPNTPSPDNHKRGKYCQKKLYNYHSNYFKDVADAFSLNKNIINLGKNGLIDHKSRVVHKNCGKKNSLKSLKPLTSLNSLKKRRNGVYRGDPIAQCSLGWAYECGEYGEKDMKMAFLWYQEAAKQRYGFGLYKMGHFYEKGIHVKKCNKTALKFYKLSAIAGCPHGMCALGDCYKDPDFVSVTDLMKAFNWYLEAAMEGCALGQFKVGYCYEYGMGCVKDLDLAHQYYRASAYRKKFGKFEELGYAPAQCAIGRFYRKGKFLEENKDKAFRWYFAAASQGCRGAMLKLGICAREDNEMTRNEKLMLQLKEVSSKGKSSAIYKMYMK